MAAAIYILDKEYEPLIFRNFQQDLDNQFVLGNFKTKLVSAPLIPPVISIDDINYIFLRRDDIIVLCVSLTNCDATSLLHFCSSFIQVIESYISISRRKREQEYEKLYFTKDTITEHYSLLYELFDEVMDFGIPQITEFNIIKEYIKLVTEDPANPSISRTPTSAISWRPKGIFYKKNEIFIDFHESLEFIYSLQKMKVVRNDILGHVDLRVFLSGMPNCRMGLNQPLDTSIFDNVKFHQCVNLEDVHRCINFIPPDGNFKLMSYSIVSKSLKLKPLVMVFPQYKMVLGASGVVKLQIGASLKTDFKKKAIVQDLQIEIPLIVKQHDLETSYAINFNVSPRFKTKVGSVKLNLEKKCLVWTIPKLDGNYNSQSFQLKFVENNLLTMVSEFELVEKKVILDSLHSSQADGKQDKNYLFYYQLHNELLLLRKDITQEIEDINLEEAVTSYNAVVTFQVPLMTYTGLKLEFLKIIEPPLTTYQSFPWVRYFTTAHKQRYVFKLGDVCFESIKIP